MITELEEEAKEEYTVYDLISCSIGAVHRPLSAARTAVRHVWNRLEWTRQCRLVQKQDNQSLQDSDSQGEFQCLQGCSPGSQQSRGSRASAWVTCLIPQP